MARSRKPANTNTQEDTMTDIDTTELEQDLDVETVEPDEDETEDVAEGDPRTEDKAKKEPAKPKRGDLPEGWVTPIQFAKVVGEKGLHTDRDGNVVRDVKPQMIYSYMKNSPKDDRLEPVDIEDSNGNMRSALKLDEAVAWWERKNERAATRKQNAAAKEAKKNQPKQSQQGQVETGEADPSTLESAEEAE